MKINYNDIYAIKHGPNAKLKAKRENYMKFKLKFQSIYKLN